LNISHSQVSIKRISKEFEDIPLPDYSTEGSAGADIRAALFEQLIIQPSDVKMVPTNLMMEIPRGYELQVRPRSGLAAKHGIGVLNSPGTIDSDYRGEVKVILFNFGSEPFAINRGDRIAQIILSKYERMTIVEKDELSESDRGEGGFGSTGKS
jgi:dUTP pyrophosphatase